MTASASPETKPHPRRGAAALVLLAAGLVVVSPDVEAAASLEGCGARKTARAGDACEQVLQVWGRWQRSGDDAARDAGIRHARARLEGAWTRAQRGVPACADATATSTDVFARMNSAVGAFVTAMDGSPRGAPLGPRTGRCRARLLRIAGRACRGLVRNEEARLEGNQTRAEAAAARAREKLGAAWTVANASDCLTAIGVDEADAAVERLAATVAGDATSATLRELADAAGVHVGAAVEPSHIATDPLYGPTLAAEFTSLTTENQMNWEPIHPEPDRYEFGPADELVAFAAQHGLRVRAHALLWGRFAVPAYVQNASSATELRALVADHVAAVAGRYAGRVAQWVVVNEPLTFFGDPGDTDGLDPTVFLRLLGPGYIAEALRLAHAADPHARLFVNEFGVEMPGPKQERFYRLARDLLEAGAPLHGVGFQGHLGFFGTPVPTGAELLEAVRRFAALGLEVEITELDQYAFPDDPTALARQHALYHDVLLGCFLSPACGGVTVWGLADPYSWVRVFFRADAIPLPLGDGYARKPAYFGSRAALIQARSARP